MTCQNQLAQLKESVLHEQDFNKIWQAFADLTTYPEFLEKSRLDLQANVTAMIKAIFSMKQAGSARIHSIMTFRYGDTDFYHGPFSIGTRSANFIYFEDIGIGMSAVVTGDSSMKSARFTTKVIPLHSVVPYTSTGMRPTVH